MPAHAGPLPPVRRPRQGASGQPCPTIRPAHRQAPRDTQGPFGVPVPGTAAPPAPVPGPGAAAAPPPPCEARSAPGPGAGTSGLAPAAQPSRSALPFPQPIPAVPGSRGRPSPSAPSAAPPRGRSTGPPRRRHLGTSGPSSAAAADVSRRARDDVTARAGPAPRAWRRSFLSLFSFRVPLKAKGGRRNRRRIKSKNKQKKPPSRKAEAALTAPAPQCRGLAQAQCGCALRSPWFESRLRAVRPRVRIPPEVAAHTSARQLSSAPVVLPQRPWASPWAAVVFPGFLRKPPRGVPVFPPQGVQWRRWPPGRVRAPRSFLSARRAERGGAGRRLWVPLFAEVRASQGGFVRQLRRVEGCSSRRERAGQSLRDVFRRCCNIKQLCTAEGTAPSRFAPRQHSDVAPVVLTESSASHLPELGTQQRPLRSVLSQNNGRGKHS